MPITLDRERTFLKQIPIWGQYLDDALNKLTSSVNLTGQHVGVDPTGVMPAPNPIQQLDVKTNGTGLVHATITDHNEIAKSLHYFIEYANEPSFLQPHVAHLGVSRSMPPLQLPAMDDNGNAQSWYFRAYSQYPGSKTPGQRVNHGGTTPTAINPGGTQQMTLLPSTGSGTAQNSGQEGGSGFGKIQIRPSTQKAGSR